MDLKSDSDLERRVLVDGEGNKVFEFGESGLR